MLIARLYNVIRLWVPDLEMEEKEGEGITLNWSFSEVINGQNIVPDEQVREVERFIDSIKTIKEIFHRDNMKVVFFGR